MLNRYIIYKNGVWGTIKKNLEEIKEYREALLNRRNIKHIAEEMADMYETTQRTRIALRISLFTIIRIRIYKKIRTIYRFLTGKEK